MGKSGLVLLILLLSWTIYAQNNATLWLTKAEQTNFQETSRYGETVDFCKRLEKASPWIKFTSIGKSGEGRVIPLLIVSKDKIIDPQLAFKSSKTVILIQNGIHAGEIDGKDACLMLVRDIAILKKYPDILNDVILLILPIYNVDGHERFGPHNRINQNGPSEMGWRTNATNLNLNRDYMKADAPETRAFLKLFTAWLPDFFIDIHVTDGADYQYAVTYSIEHYDNVAPPVKKWVEDKFNKIILSKMESIGYPVAPYIWFKDNKDPQKGMFGGSFPPRLSNTYSPLQNRPGLLIETHMLKDYKTRVEATYKFLQTILEYFKTDKLTLKNAVRLADDNTVNDLKNPFPVSFETTNNADTIKYLGYKAIVESSSVSGTGWVGWTSDQYNVNVPWFNDVKVKRAIIPPAAYLIPQQWKDVINVLTAHGIKLEKLIKPVELDVDMYRLKNVKWREQPYEGRHTLTCTTESFKEKRFFPSGTVLVRLNQRAAKVAIHLLEPEAPDALVAWGFFDPIFEQKEYAEDYALEKLAREMLAENTELKKEFELRLSSDTAFAKSPQARLNFFYERSPYWDNQMNLYPVARVVSDVKFVTEPVKK
jgi:hypothetical protein